MLGGMSANVPMKVSDNLDSGTIDKLEAINIEILNQITQDKTNEAKAGFDGAWCPPRLIPTLKKFLKKNLKELKIKHNI